MKALEMAYSGVLFHLTRAANMAAGHFGNECGAIV